MKPNFLIIGSPKAGTTSLYKYLSQHPKVGFAKRKEPKYFSFKDISLDFKGNKTVLDQIRKSTIQNLDDYQNLFRNINTDYFGEATPDYFHFFPAAKNIYDFNKSIKLIVILRNPIERTYSDWKHNFTMGYEPINNFRKAINLIEIRKSENYAPYFDYIEKGKYASHLERYFNYFSRNQIKILFFDDFIFDPNNTCNEVLRFLGINEPYDFDTRETHMKARKISRSHYVKMLSVYLGKNVSYKLREIIDYFNNINHHLSESDKDFLKTVFLEDIRKLEKLTNRNLEHWLK